MTDESVTAGIGTGAGVGPMFSIVVPLFNRATLIGRTLASCLSQDMQDFELIVVDDASTDDSVGVVSRVCDPRVRLLRHVTNSGVGPARNTGMAAATGAWIICLDSDDELVPGALAVIRDRIASIRAEIDCVRFMVRFDNGRLGPEPPITRPEFGYVEYLEWVDQPARTQESLVCVRRPTFSQVRYPASTLDCCWEYHLDLNRLYRTCNFPDVVRLYHQDSGNSLTWDFSEARLLRGAADHAVISERILASHGSALRRYAPRTYLGELRSCAVMHFLARNRLAGLRATIRCLSYRPFYLPAYLILAAGLVGPRPLIWLKAVQESWRTAKADPSVGAERIPA